MTTGMRQTLATAIQRSSTVANLVAAGSDPSVGNVYMNDPHPSTPAYAMPMPLPCAMPAAGLGMGHVPSPPGAFNMPDLSKGELMEKDREIERLRRELRKSDEKSNFFRNQVMTLQQQVSAMDRMTPPGAPGGGRTHSEEMRRLYSELLDERAKCQQLQSQLQAQPRGTSRDLSGQMLRDQSGHDGDIVGVLRARIQELEWELSTAQGDRDPVNSARGGGDWSTASPSHAAQRHHCPAPSPLHGMSSKGDPLDPIDCPGGHRRAVIVGCDYPGQVSALRAGVADAQQWARFFMKRSNFAEQDIRLISDDPAHYQQKGRPDCVVASRGNILRALHWLTSRITVGDQLFFIFCGHGAQIVAEEYAGQKLCENALCPTDVTADPNQLRVISDSDVHKLLLALPPGARATLIYDCCHAGQPLDRAGLNYLTEYVNRGRVDYEKLRGHPVLPRFYDLQQWHVPSNPPEAVRESILSCQAVHWAACANDQFCVELPIEERPRGVFTYIFISALLKIGVQAASDVLMREIESLTIQLKGKWRLQQDVQIACSRSTTESQPFVQA